MSLKCQNLKKNCQSRVRYPSKISFKNRGKTNMFSDKNIHCQQTHPSSNVKESSLTFLNNGREGTTLVYRRIPINKHRRNWGSRELPLEHQSNNCHRQDPLMMLKLMMKK